VRSGPTARQFSSRTWTIPHSAPPPFIVARGTGSRGGGSKWRLLVASARPVGNVGNDVLVTRVDFNLSVTAHQSDSREDPLRGRISIITRAGFAAKYVVDAERVYKDYRQHDDASVEDESKRRIWRSRFSDSEGIRHHIRPEHDAKREV
jgi:hypothetical protein